MTTTFILLIIQNEVVRRVALKDEETTVGRDAKMDILIADPAISRRQFTITARGDHVYIEMNPQSRYQAVKGGRPQRQLELYPGERFELGARYGEGLLPVAELAVYGTAHHRMAQLTMSYLLHPGHTIFMVRRNWHSALGGTLRY